jgi:hypothetical protein
MEIARRRRQAAARLLTLLSTPVYNYVDSYFVATHGFVRLCAEDPDFARTREMRR